MKRALLFAVQVSILVATLILVETTAVVLAFAAGLTTVRLFLGARSGKSSGRVIGTWEKWQVRYLPDTNSNLDANFNHVTRVITVDDEWEVLTVREREAVLSHEAGHARDLGHAAMAITAQILMSAVFISAVVHVLQGGLLHGVLAFGGSYAATFGLLVVVVARVKSLRLNVVMPLVIPVVSAVIVSREYALAVGVITLSKLVSLAILRESERRADRHAARQGYGAELINVLSSLPDTVRHTYAWTRSHPLHSERVGILSEA